MPNMHFDLFIPSWFIHGFLWSLYAFTAVSLLLLATVGLDTLIKRSRGYVTLLRAARGLRHHKDVFNYWKQEVENAKRVAKQSELANDVAWEQHRTAQEKYEALAKVAVRFMERVESGDIRSRSTYQAFKDALGTDRQLFGLEVLRVRVQAPSDAQPEDEVTP